jgi:hypothetical protein
VLTTLMPAKRVLRGPLVLLSLFLVLVAGCGDDDGSGADAASVDGAMPVADAATGADARTYEYDQNGCLTFASAGEVCGFASDDTVCALSITCPAGGGDDSQCKINCEMGTTVTCYKMADVDCLLAATAAHDCTALAACGWIL